jgi:hypothetical protein
MISIVSLLRFVGTISIGASAAAGRAAASAVRPPVTVSMRLRVIWTSPDEDT